MEGVNTLMPIAVKTGMGVLSSAIKEGVAGGNDAVEDRAKAAEAQARRQAEAEARSARQQVRELREDGQRKSARARVAAANSGLTLSGSSLLNLEALEHDSLEQVGRVADESALRVQGLLDAGAEQARSNQLSGRFRLQPRWRLGSLLRMGSQSVRAW
jgi:hypothetical protein